MDSALKQRLLGAVVLIALAIIFVPMFLSTSPPPSTTETISLPIPPQRSFETRVLPVNHNPTAAPSTSVSSASPTSSTDQVVTVDTDVPPKTDAHPEDSSTTPSSASSSNSSAASTNLATTVSPSAEKLPAPAVEKPEEKTPEKTITTSSVSPLPITSGRFAVSLGIYANHDHVVTLIANMKKLGLTASSQLTEYQGKPAERVQVGPFADRATAEAARLKIKQADPKIPSNVIESADFSATSIADSRAESPPKHTGGWAVQLGAFKSQEEANKLRDKIQKGGFSAFVDKIGKGTQPLWRVRVGPELERTNAEKTRTTLKQKYQMEGIVVAHP